MVDKELSREYNQKFSKLADALADDGYPRHSKSGKLLRGWTSTKKQPNVCHTDIQKIGPSIKITTACSKWAHSGNRSGRKIISNFLERQISVRLLSNDICFARTKFTGSDLDRLARKYSRGRLEKLEVQCDTTLQHELDNSLADIAVNAASKSNELEQRAVKIIKKVF